jgi:hypothetical protein
MSSQLTANVAISRRLSAKSPKSLTQFLQKLNEKKQAEFQQKQAGHAVSIYTL